MVKDMTQGSPTKQIFLFAMPMLVGNVFQQFYNMVDSMVVGRFVGASALASVGVAGSVMFLLQSLIIGLTMGVSVIISQFFGSGDEEGLKKSISTSIYIMLAATVLITLAGVLTAEPLLHLMQTPADNIADAKAYLYIIFAGTVTTVAYNASAAILRGVGDSKTPLYFLIIASLINVVLDLFFVIQLNMGVAGVAYATVIAQAVSSVLCIVYSWKKFPIIRVKRSQMKFDLLYFKLTLRYGIPSAVQNSFVALGLMAIQNVVNSFGPDVMAAYTGATRIDQIGMTPLMTLGMALSTFVGQNVGAGKLDRVKKGLHSTLLLVVIFCAATSTLVQLFGKNIMMLFNDGGNQTVIELGAEYLSIVSLFYIVLGVMLAFSNVLRGSGDMSITLVSSVVELAGRIIAAYVLSGIISYNAIWWSRPLAWSLALTIVFLRYRSGKWRHKAIALNHNSAEPKPDAIAENKKR